MKKLDYKEFLCFVGVLGACADLELDKKEEKMIRKMVGDDTFEDIYDIYQTLSDKEKLDVLVSYKDEFYGTAEKQQQLLNELMNIFNADGEVSAMERMNFLMIRKLIS